MTQDDARGAFLVALKSARAKKKVQLNTFESGFVEDCYDQLNYSPRQRSAIDKMVAKYAAQIGYHDSKSSLAAEAKREEEKIQHEARARQRVAVGGKLMVREPRRVSVASYKRKD